jgi:ABC-2 type transport system ATP-binding protein
MYLSIVIDDVSKRLRATAALRGLSARFDAGRLHGLIGPDGAGKTTLLRTLTGLLSPDMGTITFLDGDRPASFDEVRPRLAYMPQQQSLYPDLSVGEHLDFFRDLYQLPDDLYRPRRDELLRLTRLDRFADRPAGQLSGGMYKKLGLMCALLPSPAALLLDEPTNGVDPISRRELWDMLYRLKVDGLLILIATAYMDEAERCDHVHLMDGGRRVADGEPRALLADAGASGFADLFIRKSGTPS